MERSSTMAHIVFHTFRRGQWWAYKQIPSFTISISLNATALKPAELVKKVDGPCHHHNRMFRVVEPDGIEPTT